MISERNAVEKARGKLDKEVHTKKAGIHCRPLGKEAVKLLQAKGLDDAGREGAQRAEKLP